MASLVRYLFKCLTVEDEQQEVISVLEQVRIEIFGNKYLFLNILQFVSWDAVAISRFQQTCRANREWKKKELKEFEWEWRWKKIEALKFKFSWKNWYNKQ